MRWEMGDGRWVKGSLSLALIASFACAPAYVPTPSPPVTVPARVPVAPPPTIPAPVASRPTEGEIDGGAGKLWFRVVGRGADTVLVPLGAWLEPTLAPLGEKHTVVFYDPRHRGRSHTFTDSTAATFDGDVADLETVRASIGASRVSVIGYDYYAAVAAAYAAANPQHVTRLVLLSPIEPSDSLATVFNPSERMARLDTVAARALVKARAAGRDTSDSIRYCEDFWRLNVRLFVGDTARSAAVNPTWCQLANESPVRIAMAAERVMSSLGPAIDFEARAAGIQAPTLVMHGRLDLVANPEGAREWTRWINGARLLWLSNVGHLPTFEDAPTVIDAINEFLAGSWPPRAGPP
jgi:pimeloyl-ACP methyl ester carboxylesterase